MSAETNGERAAASDAAHPPAGGVAPADLPNWWTAAFPNPPTPSEQAGHACGSRVIRMIVAYDVTDPRRLARVAKHCEEYGERVQYSIFDCRLRAADFEEFWRDLLALIEPAEDRLVAYRVCAACADHIRAAGTMKTATGHEPDVAYIF